jgi:hypothetical protein
MQWWLVVWLLPVMLVRSQDAVVDPHTVLVQSFEGRGTCIGICVAQNRDLN